MPKTKRKTKKYWFHLGILGVLISAPNATVIKYTMQGIDPLLFNAVRFIIVFLVMSPFLMKGIHKFRKKNFLPAVKAGVYLSLATIVYVFAIKLSQASYVSIITLITPITFVLIAAKLTGEKVSSKSIAGITLAAIGAAVIVVLPVAFKQNGSVDFNPLATGLALLNTIFFPLAIINLKKANERGVNIYALMSFTSLIVATVNGLFFVLSGSNNAAISSQSWWGIIYSGLLVACLGRILSVVSYEHIGSAITSALFYLETFLAVLIPVAVLNEKLSPELVFGGILILCGVYVVEHHKSVHHKHFHIFQKH